MIKSRRPICYRCIGRMRRIGGPRGSFSHFSFVGLVQRVRCVHGSVQVRVVVLVGSCHVLIRRVRRIGVPRVETGVIRGSVIPVEIGVRNVRKIPSTGIGSSETTAIESTAMVSGCRTRKGAVTATTRMPAAATWMSASATWMSASATTACPPPV